MLGNITFFMLIWNLKKCRGSTESTTKTSLTDTKTIFSTFLTWVTLAL
jgi:hypothetical protein